MKIEESVMRDAEDALNSALQMRELAKLNAMKAYEAFASAMRNLGKSESEIEEKYSQLCRFAKSDMKGF